VISSLIATLLGSFLKILTEEGICKAIKITCGCGYYFVYVCIFAVTNINTSQPHFNKKGFNI